MINALFGRNKQGCLVCYIEHFFLKMNRFKDRLLLFHQNLIICDHSMVKLKKGILDSNLVNLYR